MGDKQQPTFDFSKLNFDLSGGGAGGFNLQGALQGLQSQLGALGMIGADSGYFQTLPKAVQRRVRALRNLDVRPRFSISIPISIPDFDFSFINWLVPVICSNMMIGEVCFRYTNLRFLTLLARVRED